MGAATMRTEDSVVNVPVTRGVAELELRGTLMVIHDGWNDRVDVSDGRCNTRNTSVVANVPATTHHNRPLLSSVAVTGETSHVAPDGDANTLFDGLSESEFGNQATFTPPLTWRTITFFGGLTTDAHPAFRTPSPHVLVSIDAVEMGDVPIEFVAVTVTV